jgi:spore photoproduct lyase
MPQLVGVHPLVREILAVRGKADAGQVRRIGARTDVPLRWVNEIPPSPAKGNQKLEDERGILVLTDRSSPFIQRFEHPKGVCCRFYKLSAYNSCNYWCEYCFLYQTFYMRPQSIHYVNYDRLRSELHAFSRADIAPRFRVLNLGELGDPLAIEDITGFAEEIIPSAAILPNVRLLFLTKSDQVDNLLRLDHNGKVILSWSMNCDLIARKLEHRTPPPHGRIEAAHRAQDAGYEIRLRFDPLFPFQGWEEAYAALYESALARINPSVVTLGTYRPNRGLAQHIASRFPLSQLLTLNNTLQNDAGKQRFSAERRVALYRHAARHITRLRPETKIALCKEPKEIWDACGLLFNLCNCLGESRHGP